MYLSGTQDGMTIFMVKWLIGLTSLFIFQLVFVNAVFANNFEGNLENFIQQVIGEAEKNPDSQVIIKQETSQSGNSQAEAKSEVITNSSGNINVSAKACASTSHDSSCTTSAEVKISTASASSSVVASQPAEIIENIDPIIPNVIKENILETSFNQLISWFKSIFRF